MSFADALGRILERPHLRNARIGIGVYPLAGGAALYEREPGNLFAAASVTKIPTCLTALDVLGPEHRFVTPVQARGEIDADGTLRGDLAIIGSGDPNLSNRVDGEKLIFTDADHTYGHAQGAEPLPGDQMAVLQALARDVYAKGIRRIDGQVRADVSLFTSRGREGGSGVFVSPIAVNDNVIDMHVTPAERAGEPAVLSFSPAVGGYEFINATRTVAAGEKERLRFYDGDEAGDTIKVTVEADFPQGPPFWTCYPVASPRRLAETLFRRNLEETGIAISSMPRAGMQNASPVEVARHVSPPLREAVRVVLKVSQNMHAELLLRASGGWATEAGLRATRMLMERAGIDLSMVAQGDGAGGYGYFTPRAMCTLLQYAARQPYAGVFRDALPVLGRDGTLRSTQQGSPAAGFVRAKTGTMGFHDEVNGSEYLSAKSLAGYIEAKSGRSFVFAAFINNLHCSSTVDRAEIGENLGEIAAAAYDAL